jgi:hypothetical protein
MSKSALTFTIITLITIIAWVFFSVVTELQKQQISEDIKVNASTLPGRSFDKNYLTDTYKRKGL